MNPSTSLSIALEAAFRERPQRDDERAFVRLDECEDREEDARDTLPVAPPSVAPPATLRTGHGPAPARALADPSVCEEVDALFDLDPFDALFDLEPFDDARRFAEMRGLLGASQIRLRASADESADETATEPSPTSAPPIGLDAITPPPPARRAGLRFGAR